MPGGGSARASLPARGRSFPVLPMAIHPEDVGAVDLPLFLPMGDSRQPARPGRNQTEMRAHGILRNSYRGAPVLVTGGMGFIGSNLVLALVREGARVTVVDSQVPGCGANPENLDSVRDQVLV